MERAGKHVDNAAEKTGDALEGAAQKTGDATEKATRATGHAFERAGDKLQGNHPDPDGAAPEKKKSD
jgi:hypothetical protein